MPSAPLVRLMVISSTAAWSYWRGLPGSTARQLRLLDLTGRPPAESLDGSGRRIVAHDGEDYFWEGLVPGRVLQLVVGETTPDGGFIVRGRSNITKLPEREAVSFGAAGLVGRGRLSYYAGMGWRT